LFFLFLTAPARLPPRPESRKFSSNLVYYLVHLT
jgi:hypothetical protein